MSRSRRCRMKRARQARDFLSSFAARWYRRNQSVNPLVNRRILLVDDDELIRDMYRHLLGTHFEVSIANNAHEALDLLSKHGPFAVVLSDFRMPRKSGVDLLREVRQSW